MTYSSDKVLMTSIATQLFVWTCSRFTDSFKKDVTSSRVDTTKLLVNAVQKSEVKPESFIGISAIGEVMRNASLFASYRLRLSVCFCGRN